MNTNTRTMRGEEAAVLLILVDEFAAGKGLKLSGIEKRMGPKGKRSPAAEAHAFLRAEGLIVTASDEHGNEMVGVWAPSETGERRLPHILRQGIDDLTARIQLAQAQNLPGAEVDRLRTLLNMLPEARASSQAPAISVEEGEEDDGSMTVAGRASSEAATPKERKPPRRRGREGVNGRSIPQDDGPRITGKPDQPMESPGGRRGIATAPPRRAK